MGDDPQLSPHRRGGALHQRFGELRYPLPLGEGMPSMPPVSGDQNHHFFFSYSSFQWPCFFSASATSFGMYFSSCLASTVSALNTPDGSSAPAVTTPCPSRNRSGSTPR